MHLLHFGTGVIKCSKSLNAIFTPFHLQGNGTLKCFNFSLWLIAIRAIFKNYDFFASVLESLECSGLQSKEKEAKTSARTYETTVISCTIPSSNYWTCSVFTNSFYYYYFIHFFKLVSRTRLSIWKELRSDFNVHTLKIISYCWPEIRIALVIIRSKQTLYYPVIRVRYKKSGQHKEKEAK